MPLGVPQEALGGDPQEVQVQCALLQALLLMMPLSADSGATGESRDPTSALVRTLYPVVRQVNPQLRPKYDDSCRRVGPNVNRL